MRVQTSVFEEFGTSTIPAANVSSVPQRSPLRYPGGKTWLVPHIRKWLTDPVDTLIEPFAGGGIISLTTVMEGFAKRALMVEIDQDLSAFWRAVLDDPEELIERIQSFAFDRTEVERLTKRVPSSDLDRGFRTLVLNRTRYGGVLAPEASLIRSGENGAGIGSRWYPETLVNRVRNIARYSDQLLFCESDGVRLLELQSDRPETAFFVDPPYTAKGGKQAGSRLYTHNTVDHARIFATLARSRANFLMTYDCSSEIIRMIRKHKFHAALVTIKNLHHLKVPELIITRDKLFT
ncbi:MAG: DNA adenine methylase [Rhodothermaceae bacterium]|nr:DNA adenine methylase [Rhodothermaceae bacterium]MXZ57242.1 DNA adenine methylase [Rhodothermaceae bacterium]MYB90938.1 DNA adenine methylase [Rhodothermaceae bacterium]MYD67813.1 DNA adenine methylase [Rhodothermaceae bacterium]MYG45108.1 DNA adenine methylase [Rhodothermaceae bacterium]